MPHVSAAAWLQLILALFVAVPASSGQSLRDAVELATLVKQQVDRRLAMPATEQRQYATLLARTLAEAGFDDIPAQYVVLVDRNAFVQATMIFWKSDSG